MAMRQPTKVMNAVKKMAVTPVPSAIIFSSPG
jgi:hypothetical protein